MVSPLTPKGGIRVDFLVNNYTKLMKLLDFINDIGQIFEIEEKIFICILCENLSVFLWLIYAQFLTTKTTE
jgi:hypothetical protein